MVRSEGAGEKQLQGSTSCQDVKQGEAVSPERSWPAFHALSAGLLEGPEARLHDFL